MMPDDHSTDNWWKLLASFTWRVVVIFLLIVLFLPELLYKAAKQLFKKLGDDMGDIGLKAHQIKQTMEKRR